MAERPKESKTVDIETLLKKNIKFEVRTESKDERDSRLRREEAEDAHKHRISLIIHIFVMTIVAVAFLASTYIAIFGDPKTPLPDKAMSIIMAIVVGSVSYLTGKVSK